MNNSKNYPPRGEFDGTHYADRDGVVHVLVRVAVVGDAGCSRCSVIHFCDGLIPCGGLTRFERVPGAYVPTDNERRLMDALEGLIRAVPDSLPKAIAAREVIDAVRSGRGANIKEGC